MYVPWIDKTMELAELGEMIGVGPLEAFGSVGYCIITSA